jgi:hypothetical protein
VVRVADVGAGGEVAVSDAADEAGHGGELDGPLGEVLVAPTGVGDQAEGRVAVFRDDAQRLDDARGGGAGVDGLEDAGEEVSPELGPQGVARRVQVAWFLERATKTAWEVRG